MNQYAHYSPAMLRELIAKQHITGQTSGMALGYAQANLVILPKEYADDFEVFCAKNPKPCPILEIVRGTKFTQAVAKNGNIYTDIPEYYVYENGVRTQQLYDVESYFNENMVGFLIGCSFSFEESLLSAGLGVRHIEQQCNVPMYRTNIACQAVGAFKGNMVVSMRPYTREQALRAEAITAQFPSVHGAPIHLGDPEAIGIVDLSQPDFGDAVEIKAQEIPVFWACGVTPQNVILEAKLPLVITHSPGCMFITDIQNAALKQTAK